MLTPCPGGLEPPGGAPAPYPKSHLALPLTEQRLLEARTKAALADIGSAVDRFFLPHAPVLPPGSASWTPLEEFTFLGSGGSYNPNEMVKTRRVRPGGSSANADADEAAGEAEVAREVPGRVSIVTPTTASRSHFNEQLWACFEAQDWEDKELVVLESYETAPSEFWARRAEEDARLVLVTFQRPKYFDLSIGVKRDIGLHLASGDVVVNFDDDDVYAPGYVSSMVGELRERDLVALTLSQWYNFVVPHRMCGYSDPLSWWDSRGSLDHAFYGYGFSYVHTRSVALTVPYPCMFMSEDTPFMFKLRELYGDEKVGLRKDTRGICLHIVHTANSCGITVFEETRYVFPKEAQSLEVSDLPCARKCLDLIPNTLPARLHQRYRAWTRKRRLAQLLRQKRTGEVPLWHVIRAGPEMRCDPRGDCFIHMMFCAGLLSWWCALCRGVCWICTCCCTWCCVCNDRFFLELPQEDGGQSAE